MTKKSKKLKKTYIIALSSCKDKVIMLYWQ